MADVRVRDFVYLDVERLKSIIAQIEEGLAESHVATAGASRAVSAGIEGGVLGFLKGASDLNAAWHREVAETRSLHDYLYNKVESALLKLDFLVRLPGAARPHNDPVDSRSSLAETTFFLATGRVALNDFSQMRLILDNFNAIGKFIARSHGHQASGKQRRDLVRAAEDSMKLDPELLKGFHVLFDTFYRDRIVIKLVPFASDQNFRLVGNLNPELLRDNIDSITYKYGTSPGTPWTMFGQIAAIPAESGWQPMNLVGGAAIEAAFQGLFDQMRGIEVMAQSVVYPEVSVTPIAVYRESRQTA